MLSGGFMMESGTEIVKAKITGKLIKRRCLIKLRRAIKTDIEWGLYGKK